ncbi:MAG: phage holin [Peptococcaceae bacterium]|nr:phage holin [Peptococcaceae bacterium]
MSKEQIAMLVRTAVLFLALLNQLLMVFGYTILPVSEEALSELLTALFTTASALWVWWNNKRTI